MAYLASTVAQFQAQFTRDFPYGTDPNTSILDSDITNAFNLVDITINQCLWDSQNAFTTAYNYLAAHFLVMNLRASSQGLSGQYSWAQTSKSVGSVSESFQIPERLMNNPDFLQYTKTYYGAMYINLLWPQLAGNMFSVLGHTKP
jgi:hypothetical protein